MQSRYGIFPHASDEKSNPGGDTGDRLKRLPFCPAW